MGRSCGNRHCPTCGKEKTYAWLEKQTRRLLPVHHFLVTFTVPEELRSVLRGRQRDGYRALFDAGSQSIRDVGSATESRCEVASSASSVCCTPGVVTRWSIILTFTSSFPAAE